METVLLPGKQVLFLVRNVRVERQEKIMASIVVCAEPGSWQQATRFAQEAVCDAELKSFEALRRRAPVQPLLVFLTNTHYHRLRSLLRTLKPGSPDVVIYYANRLAPEDAAQLGKLVGETRPNHTSVVFEVKAAATSVLGHSRSSSLDLEEVDLVDVEGVRFLNTCEVEGVSVLRLLAFYQGMDAKGTRSAISKHS
jgi:hypothetical protein